MGVQIRPPTTPTGRVNHPLCRLHAWKECAYYTCNLYLSITYGSPLRCMNHYTLQGMRTHCLKDNQFEYLITCSSWLPAARGTDNGWINILTIYPILQAITPSRLQSAPTTFKFDSTKYSLSCPGTLHHCSNACVEKRIKFELYK